MDNKIKLNFLAGVQVENKIFFSAWNMNGLFEYNPKTEECNFLKIFPGEEDWGLHSEAVLYQNTIWFIPRASERIAIFHLKNMDISYLDLPRDGYRAGEHIPPMRMKAFYKEGDKNLWLLPFVYKLFIRIDMEKQKIINIEKNWSLANEAASVGVKIQDKLWIYKNNSNELRIIGLANEKQETKKIDDYKKSYLGIQNIDKWILLFPRYFKDGILLLNKDTFETKIVYLKDNEQWYYQYQTFTKNGDILLVPYVGDECIQISVEEEKCFIKKTKKLDVGTNAYCSTKIEYNDEIWFLSHIIEVPIICYERRNNQFKYRSFEIERTKYNNDIVNCIKRNGVEYNPMAEMKLVNEQYYTLNSFLHFIKRDIKSKNDSFYKENGKKIYIRFR